MNGFKYAHFRGSIFNLQKEFFVDYEEFFIFRFSAHSKKIAIIKIV